MIMRVMLLDKVRPPINDECEAAPIIATLPFAAKAPPLVPRPNKVSLLIEAASAWREVGAGRRSRPNNGLSIR